MPVSPMTSSHVHAPLRSHGVAARNEIIFIGERGSEHRMAYDPDMKSDLAIYNARIMHMPNKLHVYGLFRLNGVSGITSLPTELTVSGSTILVDCPHLQHIPETINLEGDLAIASCPLLRKLPPISIGGELFVNDFTSIVIPREFKCTRISTYDVHAFLTRDGVMEHRPEQLDSVMLSNKLGEMTWNMNCI